MAVELKGPTVGPGPSYFYTFVQFEITEYQDTRAYLRRRIALYVTPGSDFYGTYVNTTWGGRGNLYGEGVYFDSGWVDYGWVDYGSSAHISGSASYTGSRYYNSHCDAYYSPPPPTWAPYAPTNASATRASDNRNNVSWANNPRAARPYAALCVERSVDGGAWSEIAVIRNSNATSHVDGTTSANHFYRYRVRAHNGAGHSGYSGDTATLYNTPAAPAKLTPSRKAETTVEVVVSNGANTATSMAAQRSSDRTTWADLPRLAGKIESFEDAPGGGTFYYRARNVRDSLMSAWSPVSDSVVTITPPAAPTLRSPASGSTLSKALQQLDFSWAHNPIDGSVQTAAEFRVSADNGKTWTKTTLTTAASLSVDNTFAVNTTVTWSVRTKGAHADFGEWSANRVLYIRQQPSVAFATPGSDFVLTDTPVKIALQYNDASGSLASAKVAVADGATQVYAIDMGTSLAAEIKASDWMPENGKKYTLSVVARSSSSLQAEATREIKVEFIPPAPAHLGIDPDPDTGHVTLSIFAQALPGFADVASISLFRVVGSSRVLLGDELQSGETIVDMYAPLNIEYSYETVSFADSGSVNPQRYDGIVETTWAFIYFAGGVAKAQRNPSSSFNIDPSCTLVDYVGRAYPVAYMSDNRRETHEVSAQLHTRGEAEAFRRMAEAGELVVYKSWDGFVFRAVASVDFSPALTISAVWGDVSVNLERVDGTPL